MNKLVKPFSQSSAPFVDQLIHYPVYSSTFCDCLSDFLGPQLIAKPEWEMGFVSMLVVSRCRHFRPCIVDIIRDRNDELNFDLAMSVRLPVLLSPIYPPIRLFVRQSIRLYCHLSVHLSFRPSASTLFRLSVRPSVYSSIGQSVLPSVRQFTLSSACPFYYLSDQLSFLCPSVHSFVCLSVQLLIYPSICPFVRPLVHSFVNLSVQLLHPSVLPFVCQSVRSSACPCERQITQLFSQFSTKTKIVFISKT